jgi:hypothetical protein
MVKQRTGQAGVSHEPPKPQSWGHPCTSPIPLPSHLIGVPARVYNQSARSTLQSPLQRNRNSS